MSPPIVTAYYNPLGFTHIFLWYLLVVPLTIPQSLLLLQLSWKSVGVVVTIRKSIIGAAVLGPFSFLSRGILPVSYHILVYAVLLFLLVWIIGHIHLSLAIIATVFAETIMACGTIIIVEPLLMLVDVKTQEFLLQNPVGYCVGITLETIVPATVLFILVRNKISLFGRTRKDAIAP